MNTESIDPVYDNEEYFAFFDDGPPDPFPDDEGFEDYRREVFRTECRVR